MTQIISTAELMSLAARLLQSGVKVAAPVAATNEKFFYQYLKSPSDMVLSPSIFPANSLKEFLFPRHEILYHFHTEGKEVLVEDSAGFDSPQVVFGARPCDAAAIPIVAKVFSWDFQDRFFQQRVAKTTIVTVVCAGGDTNCFCTSVGLSPATIQGSDAVLLAVGNDQWEVHCHTEKGRALFGESPQTSATNDTAIPSGPPVQFDVQKVRDTLAANFDNPMWQKQTLSCVGCGVCTYVCPTCHCFDMVDEGSPRCGTKVKNWDSCQFAMFTHHASGHNPRGDQSGRQRNRIQHKFRIYPEKFDDVLCTGCGNCSRGCAAGLGVLPLLKLLAKEEKAQEVTANSSK